MEFTDAINRFRGPLVGLIVAWGVPHGDAAEIAQDSFVDAYLNRERCLGDCSDPAVFGRWLRGIARNKFRNWLRGRTRRERRVVCLDPAMLEQTSALGEQSVDPRIAILRVSIERLPPKQRQVILMHYLEETSVNDVAALLSVTAKTVEGRLYQARRTLRRLIDESRPARFGKA